MIAPMNKAAAFCAVLLMPVLFPGSALAAFKFDQTLVEVQPGFGEERLTVTFPFTNLDTPGSVRSIETSCGCLSATADKKTYAAGEKGMVTAVFNIKGYNGSVERSITFVSGSKGDAPIRLAVRVHVPELIEIEPKMLSWGLGEAVAPKVFKVTVKSPDAINIKSIASTRRNVSVALKTVTPGRAYEIEVKPETTSEVMLGMVKIDTDIKAREQQRQMAFFRIDKKG